MILDEAGGKLTPEDVYREEQVASSQIFYQLEIIICWTNCFATEDEFIEPHVEKDSMLSDRH